MYMSVPLQRDANSGSEKLKPAEIEIANALKALDGKLSNEEYNKLWQELRHTGKDFDKLYEDCKTSTYQFKDHYDEIKRTEKLNEALKQLYYQALSTKKKHEEDREKYFKNDKDLAEMKEEFIEETQKLALSNSRYVEYNQRFSVQREQYISRLLTDVNKANERNNRLQTDRDRLNRELAECRSKIRENKESIDHLTEENGDLRSSCRNLEKIRENLKKEAEWMLRQNKKLKDANSRVEADISSASQKILDLQQERNDQTEREQQLQASHSALDKRCSQLQQLVESLNDKLQNAKDEMDKKLSAWEEERQQFRKTFDDLQKKTEKARTSNYKTMLRNQNLREKLKSANHQTELATRTKDNAVLRDHRTQKTNVELCTKQLYLIDEVLELKSDFFRDQARIQKAAKLNKRLETTVDSLKEKITILRHDPTAVIPMEDAQEYRELTRQKFLQKQLLTYSSARAASSTVARVT